MNELEYSIVHVCVCYILCVYKGFLLSTVINSILNPMPSSFNASRNYKSNGQHQEQKIYICPVKDCRTTMMPMMLMMPMMTMVMMVGSYKNQSIVDFNYVHRYLDGESAAITALGHHIILFDYYLIEVSHNNKKVRKHNERREPRVRLPYYTRCLPVMRHENVKLNEE